jgi:hypothetical protein
MRLLLRISYPRDLDMIVKATLDRKFLEHTIKLVLICEKIKRTTNGAAKVTIENVRGEYALLESQGLVQWVMTKAGVMDWQAIQYLVLPDDLLLNGAAVWLRQECEAGPSLMKAVCGSKELMEQANMLQSRWIDKV